MKQLTSLVAQFRAAPGATALGAISIAGLLFASVLVARSAPRPDIDLDLSDGAVWLSSTSIGGVSLLDGGSGTIATSLGVANPGDDFSVEQWGSDAVVVNRTDGTVSRLDGSSWTITTGRVQFGEPGQPLDVVTGDDSGWVMTPGQTAPLDLELLASRAPVPVAAPFTDGVITSSGALLYASSDPQLPVQLFPAGGGGAISVTGLDGPTALADLGQETAGIDLDDRRVWLEDEGIVCDQLEFPAGSALHGGGDSGRLIVVSDQGGAFVWDPTVSGCPTADDFINIGPGAYGAPALTDGWAVVPDLARAAVLVIDLDSGSLTNTQTLQGVEPGTEIDLVAEDGAIWYNDPSSASAGLIRRDGTVLPIAKYEEGATGFTAAPVDDPEDDANDISVAGQQQTQDEPESEDEEETATASTAEVAPVDESEPEPEEPTTPTTNQTPDTTEQGPEETTDTTEQGPEETTDTTDDGGSEETTETTDGGTTETTDGGTPGTTEEPEGVVITMAVSANQIVQGETINFTAVTQHGSPNNWESAVSPAGPELQPIEAFGSFRYLFSDPGRYIVSITACEPDGDCDTARVQVEVLEDPDFIELIAAFNGPSTAKVGDDVGFTDASQGSPDEWAWDFDGATPATSSAENPTAQWDTAGTKTVTLTVTRDAQTDTFSQQIVIEELTPDPSPFGLSCDRTRVVANEIVVCSLQPGDPTDFDSLSFTATADTGTPTVNEREPGRALISLANTGLVTVTLRGIDKGTGQQVVESTTVEYWDGVICTQAIPNPTISGPTSLTVGQTGSFTGDGEVCTTPSFSWSAQGGASISAPTSQTTGISWPAAGTYTITLNYDSGGSGSNTTTHTVTVTDPAGDSAPVIAISGPSDLERGQTGSFTSTNSGGPIDSYNWTTTGGGGSGSGSTFDGTWASEGNYTVTLNVSGPGGNDSATFDVYVFVQAVQPSPFGMTCDQNSAVVDEIFSCGLTTGDPNDFSNPQWSVGPASALSWLMSPWSYDAAGTVVGSTVTVTLTATDLATGQTVSASDSVQITAPPVPALGLSCSPSSVPADGSSAATCRITNGSEFTSISYSVSNPSGLNLNQWGAPGETYIGSFDAGSITVSASATHTSSGQSVSAGPVTITFDPVAAPPPPPEPAPMSVSCSVSTATTADRFTCQLSSGNQGAFSSPSWSIAPGGTLSWGGAGSFSIDVQGTAAGTVTVTLTATDIATGTLVSASANVTIT